LDRATNATWRDRDQPFVPGRLDFLLFADSSLILQRADVIDTRDLDPGALADRRLKADDSSDISDHLPVIADLAWRTP
jgi:hypothetical protein